MKATSAALADHLAGPVTTLATCWRIIRVDGKEFFFTDHDRDILFEGNIYKASSSYSRTAIANDSSLGVDNLDIEGVFDSAAITEEELRAGLFDQAEVRIFLVNWADPSMGSLRMRRGWFGEVVLSEQGIFRTELRGMTQALAQRIGEFYSPECRADLGDHRCKVPIHPPEIARSTAYDLGDVVRVRTTGTTVSTALPIVNGGFEADGTGDGAGFTPTGWILVSGDWDVHDASSGGLTPASGNFYLEGGSSASGELAQTLDLVAAGLDPAQIDADAYRLDLSVSRANSFADDLGRVIVEALDGSTNVLSTILDTGFEAIVPEDSWVQRGISQAQLPLGTRSLRIRLLHRLVTGSQSNAAFDAVSATVTDTTASVPTSADFENRIYRCVTAGTTAAAQPAYDTTICGSRQYLRIAEQQSATLKPGLLSGWRRKRTAICKSLDDVDDPGAGMCRVELYGRVRLAVLRDCMSRREAARVFGIDRGTVSKILRHAVPPGYQRVMPVRPPKLADHVGFIDRILDEDAAAPRKQRHTVQRIFERLRNERGYDGGYSTVRDDLRPLRSARREVFVPRLHPTGHAQADFGEAVVVLGGAEQKIRFFVMDLPRGDAIFVKA